MRIITLLLVGLTLMSCGPNQGVRLVVGGDNSHVAYQYRTAGGSVTLQSGF